MALRYPCRFESPTIRLISVQNKKKLTGDPATRWPGATLQHLIPCFLFRLVQSSGVHSPPFNNDPEVFLPRFCHLSQS